MVAKIMTAKELVCVNCRNWKSEKCRYCIEFYISKKMVDPNYDIFYQEYEHTCLTPEEWERRTGKKWTGAVWMFDEQDSYVLCNPKNAESVKNFRKKHKCPELREIICNGPEVPDNDREG
jgi:hypothetical protein